MALVLRFFVGFVEKTMFGQCSPENTNSDEDIIQIQVEGAAHEAA